MDLDYLIERFDAEAEKAEAFREDVRGELFVIKSWIGVREAVEADRKSRETVRKKQTAWIVGIVVSVLGVLLPIVWGSL